MFPGLILTEVSGILLSLLGRQRMAPENGTPGRGNSMTKTSFRVSGWRPQGQALFSPLSAPAAHIIGGTGQDVLRTETMSCSSRCPQAQSEFGARLPPHKSLSQLICNQGPQIHGL